MKKEREIEELLNRADEFAPSKFPGMTYEQGVSAALGWVLGLDPDEFPDPLS